MPLCIGWVPRNIDVPPSPPLPPLPPPWIELPWDVTANILQRLGSEGMLTSAPQVCTTWWKVCKDPSLWRVIDFSDKKQGPLFDKYMIMCRCAVDRSQGQLVDLTIQYFGNDKLMEYITERSPNLKRLKLGTCFNLSGDVATRMFAKLVHLEELHLTIRKIIGAADIEAIGKCCPMLKSFSCNGFKYGVKTLLNDDFVAVHHRNLYAFAISKSMPNLRHLQLFAHWIGNEGLEAILHCCPRLESLDIRRCFDLDLEGDLGKRCCRKIKHLKLPNDSISDIPWPNCDGGDPFDSSARRFEFYEYNYYKDYEDYCRRYGSNFNLL
ncbi:putative F-box/LRR-repeat protein 23 [Salvia hispanica]|uniref:putative F-box/LRR-repeat protein 23 n=1 Tax=Salvia hispanica TaxID=49212 RepID=UPI002009A8D1|nr:putative F-box/LRR-repeat protein 23 [Salvia hispanica]